MNYEDAMRAVANLDAVRRKSWPEYVVLTESLGGENRVYNTAKHMFGDSAPYKVSEQDELGVDWETSKWPQGILN